MEYPAHKMRRALANCIQLTWRAVLYDLDSLHVQFMPEMQVLCRRMGSASHETCHL